MKITGTVDVELEYANSPREIVSIDCSEFSLEEHDNGYMVFVHSEKDYRIEIQINADRLGIVGQPTVIAEITDEKEISYICVNGHEINRKLE